MFSINKRNTSNQHHLKLSLFHSFEMNTLSLLLISLLVSTAASRQVCYDDLGCFTDAQPFGSTWQRPIALLPESPQKISTKFMLYKREFAESGIQVGFDNLPDSFDPKLKTVVITHGFFGTVVPAWALEVKDAILQVEDVNVVTVDWTKGNQFPYIQAVANTQVNMKAPLMNVKRSFHKQDGV